MFAVKAELKTKGLVLGMAIAAPGFHGVSRAAAALKRCAISFQALFSD
jgi:hypothetical protein